jgi:eukaryotic-like serine/threonine-protein kinase
LRVEILPSTGMAASPEQMPTRRYRIERYLTEGGMGAIYVGKKLGPGGFEKEVVLKQLLPEYTARPEFRDLFFREAKISATLDHANIVHVFDLVESDESLFIVMEYVRGVDLRTIIRRSKLRRRELSPAAALHITLEILAGLSYAHTRRTSAGESMAIIHRDVSPSNILCSVQGEVKLSDFGIAKAATHSSAFYRVRGKVGYMSPEQARSQPIDHRTDLYSVAVCLYEALTAERLFVGDLSTPADVIYAQPIVAPSQKRAGLPTALDAVLKTALSPDPADRYQDSIAFADALRQVAHRHGLLYSAPQLGEHLRYILGNDPQRWLTDDKNPTVSGDPSTQKIPARELEGKEAQSIGVVEASGLYVVSGNDMVNGAVPPKDPKRTPKSGLSRRLPDPAATPGILIPVEEEDQNDVPTRVRHAGPDATPPPPVFAGSPPAVTPPPPVFARPALVAPPPPRPPRRTTIPPPLPPAAVPPPPVPESPFDIPPTPGPVIAEEFPPTPPPMSVPSPYPPSPYAPAQPPVLPRPGGYLAQGGFNPAVHAPAAPAHVNRESSGYNFNAGFNPNGGFNLAPPETIDFGADTIPVAETRRSGPPGLVILIVLVGAAIGGAKLGQLATRADLAALQAETTAQTAAARSELGVVPATARSAPDHK